MKELSIEKKAKAYDEAIKKAESLYKVSEPMSGCNVIIETIFPELKESEDEKIRKELIRSFQSLNTIKVWNGIERTDILAWLEKQGKQIDIANKEYWRGYREGKKEILDKYAEIEKQGEQKLSDEEMKTLLRTEYEKGRADAIAEMQMEWSEEDSYYRNHIIQIIEEMNNAPLKRKEDWEAYINWLKSLKGRIHPQSQWKPSESDIIILEKVIKGELEPEIYQTTLHDILEQLKKLKKK